VIPVGIFGDMAIALNPELGPVRRFIASGDTVPTGRGSPTTAELLERVDSISRTVTTMTDAIQVELVKNGGVADLHRTILQTNQLIGQLGVIAAEQSRQLSSTQQSLRRSLASIDSSRVDSTVKNLEATSANIERLTRDLGQTSTRLNSVLAKLDSTSGSAGALLNDPGLYRDMRGLVTRLDSLTLDFQKNPRRYINLRVF
jgi:phospholipid/cholesterol/gamma-HCH transport system substrate-binding protein